MRKIAILVVVAGICVLLLFGYTRNRSKASAASAPPQRGAGQQAVPVAIAAVTQGHASVPGRAWFGAGVQHCDDENPY